MKIIFSTLAALIICVNAAVYGISAKEAANSFVDGHKVYVGKTTNDGTFWKYELLRNAKKSIEMSCGYAHGEVFLNVYNILKEQLGKNPEIQIHFMVSQNAGLFTEENENLLKDLKKRYPKNFYYLITGFSGPIVQENGLYTTENHMKLIIVDEKYFHLGGTNLVDNLSQNEIPADYDPTSMQEAFLPKASCDQDVVVSGPMARKLREEFYQIFELYKTGKSVKSSAGHYFSKTTEYTPVAEEEKTVIDLFENNPDLVSDVKAYATVSGPRFNFHLIGDLYEHYIKEAQISIDLAHMYLFPIDKIYNALIDTANRYVEINIFTNGLNIKATTANSTIALYTYINRVNYLPLMLGKTFRFWQKDEASRSARKGVLVYEYDKEFMLYHKKVLIVDNKFSTVGSYNLGKKSENSDFEVNIFMESPEVALKLHDNLMVDKAASKYIRGKDAIDYHFSFYYNLMKGFESTFFDGIILSVDDLPKETVEIDSMEFPGFDTQDSMGWEAFDNFKR